MACSWMLTEDRTETLVSGLKCLYVNDTDAGLVWHVYVVHPSTYGNAPARVHGRIYYTAANISQAHLHS